MVQKSSEEKDICEWDSVERKQVHQWLPIYKAVAGQMLRSFDACDKKNKDQELRLERYPST